MALFIPKLPKDHIFFTYQSAAITCQKQLLAVGFKGEEMPARGGSIPTSGRHKTQLRCLEKPLKARLSNSNTIANRANWEAPNTIFT